jgi:uncharacterized membrane protein YphA (DoxX/SURF4 family)
VIMTGERISSAVLRSRWAGTAMRIILAGVLGYAGLSKLVQPDGARTAILAYRLFPVAWADVLGWALPAAEVALALLLLIGIFVRWAALATAVLMFLFVAGIISAWARGFSIDCGCFGGGGDLSPEGREWRYIQAIARDLLFAGMAVRLWVWTPSHMALEAYAVDTSLKPESLDVPADAAD